MILMLISLLGCGSAITLIGILQRSVKQGDKLFIAASGLRISPYCEPQISLETRFQMARILWMLQKCSNDVEGSHSHSLVEGHFVDIVCSCC